jgi:hypothetical protein
VNAFITLLRLALHEPIDALCGASGASLTSLAEAGISSILGNTRGPQRPAPFAVLLDLRDGMLYIRPAAHYPDGWADR